MPRPHRSRAGHVHHHQAHGPQSDPKSARQGFHPPPPQSRRLGRRLPGKSNCSLNFSPDSPDLGWARTLVDHSQTISHGTVTILPGVYATQSDDTTWRAVAEASQRGAQTQGAWVARWRIRGCGMPLDWDPAIVMPRVKIPCEVLLWQYADECHGGDGFDCNETNPNIDLQDILSQCVLPPDTPVA